jgi:phage terminase large subunit-like protein
MGKSLAARVAELPEAERNAVLASLDPEALQWDWSFWARPEQMPPNDDSWNVGLYLAGRGAGKTRAAAEWVREKAKISNMGVLRFALIARTAADVRDVIVEGESGIIAVSPPSEKPLYEPSKRRLTWPNGNTATCFTADEPDSLRGIQAHYTWCDELAAWRQNPDAAGMTSWDNARVACRLGPNPQILATTTPKRVPILYNLLAEAEKTGRTWIGRGTTLDNAGNLSSGYLDAITGVYAGTRLAAQELYGEMLSDVEGALWTDELISRNRETGFPHGSPLRVVGVDPSVAENPRDECGIVVCASTGDRDLYKRHAWVLEDASIHGSPEMWANAVVAMARKYSCPVVAEVNQGGALVTNAILAIDPSIKVLEVHSKFGKALRAEPVTLAYEQGRVHHLNFLADLESQMISWIPGQGKSPDRVDALVHALTALLIKPPPGFVGGTITAKSHAQRRLPAFRGGASSTGVPGRGARIFNPNR